MESKFTVSLQNAFNPAEYKSIRLREEIQALEKFLYSLSKTQELVDALFSFGYIQAELLAVCERYEKQAMPDNLFDKLSELLQKVIAHNGCWTSDFLPAIILPESLLDDFLNSYACWTGRPGLSGSDVVKTIDLEQFRQSIPPGFFGDGEIVLDGLAVSLRKDAALTSDFYVRLYQVP